jgi:hypothetical protein
MMSYSANMFLCQEFRVMRLPCFDEFKVPAISGYPHHLRAPSAIMSSSTPKSAYLLTIFFFNDSTRQRTTCLDAPSAG